MSMQTSRGPEVGLALAVRRVDAVIQEDRRLIPRMLAWLQGNVMSDLRVVLRHAAGLPPRSHGLAKPQSAIVFLLFEAVGTERLQEMVARSQAHGRGGLSSTC